jgi:hypothetical protein
MSEQVDTNIDGIPQEPAAPAVVIPEGCAGVEFKFNFKARNLYNEEGKVMGKGKKQPSVVTVLPIPTHNTVAAFLSDPASKESDLIMAAVSDLIYGHARNQFDEIIDGFEENDGRTVNAGMLDLAKLDLSYLANLPPSTRASTVPTEDDFKGFFADYLAVMPAATGKATAAIEKHIKLFTKPAQLKANKPVMELLLSQLDLYMAHTTAIEETGATASYLRTKLDRWFKEPEKAIDLSLL